MINTLLIIMGICVLCGYIIPNILMKFKKYVNPYDELLLLLVMFSGVVFVMDIIAFIVYGVIHIESIVKH